MAPLVSVFSDTLPVAYFAQLASERRVVRMSRGTPVRRFERLPGRAAEALDALVLATAARQLVHVPLDDREAVLRQERVAPPPTTSVASRSSKPGRRGEKEVAGRPAGSGPHLDGGRNPPAQCTHTELVVALAGPATAPA